MIALHDTRLRFALGSRESAHHFESETFAREEGDRLCQEVMGEAHAMHRPLVLVAVTSPDSGVCEIVSGITGASYGYLRATNHRKGNQ